MANAGLIGSMKSGAKSAFTAFNSSLVHLFVFFVVGAATLSIIEFTITKSSSAFSLSFWKLLLLGLGCIVAELLGLKNAILAWHKARFGGMVAWSLIWACGFAFSLYNALGSASEFQSKRANSQLHQATAYADSRNDLAAARQRVQQEEAALKELRTVTWSILPKVDGKDVASVGAAQALIASYEGNARFMSLSNNCTAAQGPQARKFCADYADAKAAKANLEEKAAWSGKIADVEKQLADARAHMASLMTKASHIETVQDDKTPFVATMVAFGMSAEAAQFLEPLQTSFTNMLLVSLAGVVIALSAIQGQAREKWVDWNGVKRTLVGGEDVPAAHTLANTETTAQHSENGVRTVIVEKSVDEIVKRWAAKPEVQKLIAA